MFFALLITTLFYFFFFKIIIAITLIRYLVKNFISCLEACSEVIFFSPFGDSFCDYLKIANDLSVKLCDNAMQTLSISAYIRI